MLGCSVNGFVALVVVYMVGQVQVEHPQKQSQTCLERGDPMDGASPKSVTDVRRARRALRA